jgi:hypothetical protein
MRNRMAWVVALAVGLALGLSTTGQAQQPSHEAIGDFMSRGSLKVVSVKLDTVLELAHSVELFPYPMAWLPGKDLQRAPSGAFEVTASWVPTSDDKGRYMVLMIPDNERNLNIRVERLQNDTLRGELLLAEYMFYDPQNPPTLPPPTYIQITREASRVAHPFDWSRDRGRWDVVKVEGCEIPMPFAFTLGEPGEAPATAKGAEVFFTWKPSPAGGFIHFETGEFSEGITGMKIDARTIEAYSEVSRCRFLIQKATAG